MAAGPVSSGGSGEAGCGLDGSNDMTSERLGSGGSSSSGGDGDYLLEFKDYAHFWTSGLIEWARNAEQFVDVSLLCASGSLVKAHRVILAASSPYFQRVLSNPDLAPRWQHPVLLMTDDIPEQDLKDILAFVYQGRVHVQSHRLQSFLKSAQTLKIRGLTLAATSQQQHTKAKGEKAKNIVRNNNGDKAGAKRVIRTSVDSGSDGDGGGGGGGQQGKRFKRSSVVTTTITPAAAAAAVAPTAQVTNNSVNNQMTSHLPMTSSTTNFGNNSQEQEHAAATAAGVGAGDVIVPNDVMIKNEPLDLEETSAAQEMEAASTASKAAKARVKDKQTKQKSPPPPPPPSAGAASSQAAASSEHVVIPTDPTLMQGLDPNSVEVDNEQPGPSNSSSTFVERSQEQDLTIKQQQQQQIKHRHVAAASHSKRGLKAAGATLSSSSSAAAVGFDSSSNTAATMGLAGSSSSSSGGGGSNSSNLVVLFSEKGRCHFCRQLFPDVTTLRSHLESVHQPPRHALCQNCENFFHICAIQRHRQKCTETYTSEKK